MNPRTAINSLLPFQGSPFNHLGTSAWLRVILLLFTFSPLGQKVSGEGGIRTHAPLRTNGFQDRLVMTTSIPLRNCLIIISHQANNVKHLFLFFQKNFTPRESLAFIGFFQNIIIIFPYPYQIYLISNQYISSNTPHILYLHRLETYH